MTTIANLFPNGDTKRLLANWVRKQAVLKSAFRNAGLIVSNADLDARAALPGNVTSIPYYNALSGDSVVGSDNLSTHITADAMSGDEILAVRQFRTKAWAGAALASLVTGLNTREAIGNGVAEWLALDEQKAFLAYLNGVRLNALANDAATMTAGSATAFLDNSMIADASQTKGERKDALSTLIVHSAIHAKMVKDNAVTFVPASDQNVSFQSYAGKRLIVSDAMPMTNTNVYCSMLVGPGVISLGESAPEGGNIAVVHSETAGNGAGGDTLIHRRNQIVSVAGYSYTGTATQGGPDNTAIALASNHTRKYEAALIPLVFITSKSQ